MTSLAIAVYKVAIKIKTLNAIEFFKHISIETVIESGGGGKPHVCITFLISASTCQTLNEIHTHVLLECHLVQTF